KLYDLLKNFKDESWNKSQFNEFLSESVKIGEVDELDFKKDWVENEKICKLILAIANNGGGVIVIGVEESEDKYIPSGLKSFEDKARLSNNLEKFIPENLIAKIRIENYEFEKEVYGKLHDKKFQCIVIEVDNKELPYLSIKDGNIIEKNRIYTRRNTSVVDANNTEINQILERRIAT
ncbi:AlbA family DNA-binding domain-containing protein, partial [Staphylococcus haemolyticus]|uniref:AlbA family DNA-binding domain-containing protein n=1 Tax=Staphylococcus haemolyticus TaxID=1283 RepID=UPI0015D73B9A